MKSLMIKVSLMFVVTGLVSIVYAEDFDPALKYQTTCSTCHASGLAGAPKKGDQAAWAPRLAKGEDALLNSVKNGFNAMPAKGMCTDCSDDQLKALVKYVSH